MCKYSDNLKTKALILRGKKLCYFSNDSEFPISFQAGEQVFVAQGLNVKSLSILISTNLTLLLFHILVSTTVTPTKLLLFPEIMRLTFDISKFRVSCFKPSNC